MVELKGEIEGGGGGAVKAGLFMEPDKKFSRHV